MSGVRTFRRFRIRVPIVVFGTPTSRPAAAHDQPASTQLQRPQPLLVSVPRRRSREAATVAEADSTASLGHTM
jgi:hypothetical protein